MLGIPYLTDFIHRRVNREPVADGIDHLSTFYTPFILCVAALAISAKQYFGSPIQCWVPMEFRGGWEKYVEDYCFIQNSYHVPQHEEIPREPSAREDQISYYRWVPIVLALQAVAFCAPSWIWRSLYKTTAIQPESVLEDARKAAQLTDRRREVEVKNITDFIKSNVATFNDDAVDAGWIRLFFIGRTATFWYVLTKLLQTVNVLLQIHFLGVFLRVNYPIWGLQTTSDLISGVQMTESPVFPKVILCDFTIRRLGQTQNNYTVQCVIMLNMINEKFYYFLWFWLLFVLFCSFFSLLIFVCTIFSKKGRLYYVIWNIKRSTIEKMGLDKSSIKHLVNNVLREDGVLLLKFVENFAGARMKRDLVIQLLKGEYPAVQPRLMHGKTSDMPGGNEEKQPLTNGKEYYPNGDPRRQPYFDPRALMMMNTPKPPAPGNYYIQAPQYTPSSAPEAEHSPPKDYGTLESVDSGETLPVRAVIASPTPQTDPPQQTTVVRQRIPATQQKAVPQTVNGAQVVPTSNGHQRNGVSTPTDL